MIKIKNDSFLLYKECGKIIDDVIKLASKQERNEYFEMNERYYKVHIRYTKQDIVFEFSNCNNEIEIKKINGEKIFKFLRRKK